MGCLPRVIVPDNLASAVKKAHRYEPDISASYQEMAAHYGVVIIPARARKPRDKACASDCTSWLDDRKDVVAWVVGHRSFRTRTHPAALRRAA
jgi:transposase